MFRRFRSYPSYRNTYVHHPMYRRETTELEKSMAKLKELQSDRLALEDKVQKLEAKIQAVQSDIDAVNTEKKHWIAIVKGKDSDDIIALLNKVPLNKIDDMMQAAIECKNTTAIQIIAMKHKNDCMLRTHLIHCIHTCNEEAAIALINRMDKHDINHGSVDFDGFPTSIPMLSIAAEVYMTLIRENGKDLAAKQAVLSRLMIALLRNGASIHYDYGYGDLSVSSIVSGSPKLREFLSWAENMVRKEEAEVSDVKVSRYKM